MRGGAGGPAGGDWKAQEWTEGRWVFFPLHIFTRDIAHFPHLPTPGPQWPSEQAGHILAVWAVQALWQILPGKVSWVSWRDPAKAQL